MVICIQVAGNIEIGNFKMSWGAHKSATGPTFDLKGTDAAERIWGNRDNFSNEVVTERRAHGLATVYTCINVRAKTLASLPIKVYRKLDNGDTELLKDHDVAWVFGNEPNNYMSSANMMYTSVIHSDSWGNSLIGINRDGRMRPKSFEVIMPDDWSVVVKDGKAYYRINGVVYDSYEVLHYRWWSIDGLNGVSPIRQNMMTMGKAFRTEKFAARAVGQTPDMIMSYEGEQKPEQRAENQKNFRADLEAGRIPILSGRWKVDYYGLNPDEAQYIETEGLTDQKICGIFSVPPSFIQNYTRMTWSNSEQADLTFAKYTMTPIVSVMEQENRLKLFTEKEKRNTFTKYNMNGLLRGDLKARAEFYTAMRNGGFMNGNEVRGLEDMNQYEGGELYTMQSANISVDQLRDFYESKMVQPDPKTVPVKGKMNGHEILN